MEKAKPVATPPHLPFELQALAEARNYQIWLRDAALPHLGNRILEVGAGIGNLSQHLPVRERLILSEIDPELLRVLEKKFQGEDSRLTVRGLAQLRDDSLFHEDLDTIVSFNVLEHIEDDVGFLRDGIELLQKSEAPGPKRIVTLVPAHQWAYSPTDEKFGHYRRYSDRQFRKALQEAGAMPLTPENYFSRYLNLPALIAWWVKGKVFRSDSIGNGGVKAFEALCPLIRPVDHFLHECLRIPFGNSLVAVYTVKKD